MAKKVYIPTPKELGEKLLDRYERWKSIYEEGSNDPLYEDGININIVRNHILYHKKTCEEVLGDNLHLYPDSYFFPIPMEMPYDFMSVGRNVLLRDRQYVPANRTLPYSEVVKFDWGEVLCPNL